ncbi:unnamed protein product [Mycena citricolor]|nr:unnamed protein product [Mycena citricolor]
MDLGTMGVKVEKGRYRSLDDFANDLKLVTSNAKAFNPEGTIYHTEADRLETWGLDQISKAASTVIQYETDWNMDGDNEGIEDDADDYSLAVDAPQDVETRSRSPSLSLGTSRLNMLRRGPRGPYNKKENAVTVAETIDAEGRLPGSKDGLGAFPPNSDLARTMLMLKHKGKRYKTKKERLRFEKDGPPFRNDGSLDYTEVEDPFSYFSGLVPEPLTRPQLVPLYHSQPVPVSNVPTLLREATATPSPAGPSYPMPTMFPSSAQLPQPAASTSDKHWSVLRGGVPRRLKEESGTNTEDLEEHAREPHALDFGSLAVLAGELAAEMRRRGEFLPEAIEEADVLQKTAVRLSLQIPPTAAQPDDDYWSVSHAHDAETYIRDVVYGGLDGLAYARSLAEFVSTPALDCDSPATPDSRPLGMSLPTWVSRNVLDPLTGGRHALLQQTAMQLKSASCVVDEDDSKLPALVAAAVQVRPQAASSLAALRQIQTYQIDMGALLQSAEDMTHSEKEWEGHGLEPDKVDLNAVLDYVADALYLLQAEQDGHIKLEPDVNMDTGESAVLRNLRLNLLELAKRAPVDTLARLPGSDLVPELYRPFVPTLST